jgi:2,4-dienoyl-CoA reductase-like NADH-dependent reductase (Old Yellow Enzyme family)
VTELAHLFSPLRLGPVELPNRIVSTAHQTTHVVDSLPTDDFVAYHVARARGGVGLIVMEAAAVHPTGLLTSHTLAAYRDDAVEGFARVAEAVHAHGTRLFAQLFHGGREQIMASPRTPAVAPSAIPSFRYHVEPRALEGDEIDEIIAGYARSARKAADAGLDGVEITAAHTYLLEQFFTPALNTRDDRWAEGLQLALAVVAAVRESAPRLAVGVRLSADSAAAAAVASELANGVDFISIALGDASTPRGAVGIVPPPPVPEEVIVERAAPFRLGVPLIATSRVVDPVSADRLIAGGTIDAFGMTRALIADPELPRKAQEGRLDELIRCIGCNVCIAHYHAGIPIACAQNPRTGREATFPPAARSSSRKRIVVIGAGPAGLAAAREARLRGHDVVVFERQDHVGGQVALAGAAPGPAELARKLLLNYASVDARLSEPADAETVAALEPELVLLAVGARPYRPPLELDGVTTLDAWEVLAGVRPTGRVVIADWGGDSSGLDCAELLAGEGVDTTLVIGSLAVGETLHQYRRNLYLARLYRAGARIEHHLRLTRAENGRAHFENTFAPELTTRLDADALVLALGRVPESGPERELRTRGIAVRRIGDCASPRTLEEAILEGTLAVVELDEVT